MWQTALLLMMVALNVNAAEAYKCKGKNGEMIFSDQPCSANAETIQLKEPQTFSAPAVSSNSASSPSEEQSPTAKYVYREFRISAPTQGYVVEDGIDNVMVSITTDPGLHEMHKVQLYVNNAPFGPSGNQYSWALDGLERGEYQLRAELLDGKGKLIKTASSFFSVVKHVPKKK